MTVFFYLHKNFSIKPISFFFAIWSLQSKCPNIRQSYLIFIQIIVNFNKLILKIFLLHRNDLDIQILSFLMKINAMASNHCLSY